MQRRLSRGIGRAGVMLAGAVAIAGCGGPKQGFGRSSTEGASGANPASGGSGAAPPTANAGAAGMSADSDLVGLRRAAAKAGKLIGAAVDARALREDPSYAEILAREFDYVTPENATKWEELAPTSGEYAWSDADSVVEFAEAHQQAVKGHTLVWHRQNPTWLQASMTPDEVRAALKGHISHTLQHYRGRMRAWDVVNEAVDLESPSGYTESLFWEKLGPGYIEDAFRWAREADPDVLLFYNEVGVERIGPKADFVFEMLRDLLARGVPIDGIGLQSHVSIHRYPAESNLRANIRRFAELGLRVNISELDARTLLLPGEREGRWEAQRLAFQQVVGVCATEPGCEGVTLWGFADEYSWINDEGEPDDALIFDRGYAAKPAYDGVLDGLSGVLPVVGENVIENGDFGRGVEGWAVAGGEVSVGAAEGREGTQICLRGRGSETDGLTQDLRERLASGGPFAFSGRVRIQGASHAPVTASLHVEVEGTEPEELQLGIIEAPEGTWVELAGCFGLGFTASPMAIELMLQGPPAGVDLCVAQAAIGALSAP